MKKPSEVFKSCDSFLKELQQAGFEWHKDDLKNLETKWQQLAAPCSLNRLEALDVPPASFTFVTAQTKFFNKVQEKDFLKLNFALLFVDSALKLEWPKFMNGAIFRVNNADAAFDFLLTKCGHFEWFGKGVNSKINASVQMEESVVVGPDCEIGSDVVIEYGVRIGAGVKIGQGTKIKSYTRIGDFCEIGRLVQIGSHCSIGGAGFGFVKYPNEKHKRQRKHIGKVCIGDFCRIGSHVSIDRGVLEHTCLGEACIIDNHTHVAHNVEVGAGTTLCAFSGIAGSSKLGAKVTLAGMVGIADHLNIGEGATIGGFTGITNDVEKGAFLKGNPALPLKTALKVQALLPLLPEIYTTYKNFSKKLKKT